MSFLLYKNLLQIIYFGGGPKLGLIGLTIGPAQQLLTSCFGNDHTVHSDTPSFPLINVAFVEIFCFYSFVVFKVQCNIS